MISDMKFRPKSTNMKGKRVFLLTLIFALVIFLISLVLPAYQGQGIGSTLLSRCLERYPRTEWIVETIAACVSFYEKFGFTVTAVGAECVFLRRECPMFG